MAGSAREHRADIETVERTVDHILQTRLDSNTAEAPDLLGRMLNSTHGETGRRLDHANIRQQIVSFIVAGRETTSGALSFALYYLTRDTECLARAQAEVDAVWGDSDDVEPRFTDVAKLRYLRAVLDEALRLWPTAPAYLREARAETLLGGKYRMKRGDWVMILLPLLHRDPQVWPDPDRFDPGRFLSGHAKNRPAYAYRPFGTGPRACIGRQFGLHEAVLALGLVVHRYELAADERYRLQVAESFTLKPRGFTVTPRRRRRR
jgi:unspecific monooxygenase